VLAVEQPESAVPVGLESGAAADLFTAIQMTGADQVQDEGITGAGVKVGVIDTGIDYTHPDLGGGFGPGFKVEGGFDLVGNGYIGPGTIPIPDPNPMDCIGHGTHVAGIIAANGQVRGVAPGASLRAYKVFGCAGGTGIDVILAAMEMSLQDGNQVINLSLGSPLQWPQYPTNRAADNLVNKGVVVVASAGNSGESGLYTVGSPGIGRKVIGVASVENEKVHCRLAQIPGGPAVGYLPVGNTSPPPLSGSAQLKDIGNGCNTDRALFVGLQNKIAVAKRGRCALPEIILNARNHDAVAVLIYNDKPGIFVGGLGFPGIDFPAATISLEDGTNLAARARFFASLFWTNQFGEVPNMGGGKISFFSS
jgi:subtilisin family serine protease